MKPLVVLFGGNTCEPQRWAWYALSGPRPSTRPYMAQGSAFFLGPTDMLTVSPEMDGIEDVDLNERIGGLTV